MDLASAEIHLAVIVIVVFTIIAGVHDDYWVIGVKHGTGLGGALRVKYLLIYQCLK